MEQVKQTFEQLAGPLPEGEWEVFGQLMRKVYLKKGEFLVREGEFSPYVGLIQKGLFRKYYRTQAGQEYNKDFAVDGDLVGSYTSLLLGAPSRMNIEALEPTILWIVEYSEMQKLYERHPYWEKVGRRVAEIHFIEKEKREYQLLLLNATERYKQFLEEFPGLEKRVSQYHIASYLGISPVSLSRIRRQEIQLV